MGAGAFDLLKTRGSRPASLRNRLNAVLPVTANFIDPLQIGTLRAARLSRKGCRIRRKVRVAKGQQRHELTLPADWLGRQLQLVSALRRDGSVNGAAQNDQPSGGCRSPQETALPAYGNNKVLYLLIFIA